MKKLATLLIVFCTVYGFSQNSDSDTQKSYWSYKVGLNMVDNRGEGDALAGLTQTRENAFGKIPLGMGLERRFSNYFGVEAFASINSWDSGRGIIDGQLLTSSQEYYGLDVFGKLYVDELFGFTSQISWLDTYVNAGVGYFRITKGSLTANYGLGSSIWFSDKVGIDFNMIFKTTLGSSNNTFESNHFQYSMGLVVKLTGKKKPKQVVETKEEKVEVVVDSDNDSIPDNLDLCPNVPGLADNKGCPYLDTDEDGIIDRADNCPKIVGSPSNNGCPKPVEKEVKVEKITQPKPNKNLEAIAKKIKFESGNYNFTQDTYPHLIELANLLMKEPANVKFKIVGHTDSRGSYKLNRTLSKTRANAVRNYLVDSGISKDRIETVGLGESEPIDTNLTEKGRSNNRRVEIIIIK